MSKAHEKVPATKPAPIIAAIQAGHGTELVPTPVEFAREYAKDVYDAETSESRLGKTIRFLRAYGSDADILQGQVKLVRSELGKLYGFNMAEKAKNWPKEQQKLFASMCSNVVSPLATFCRAAAKHGAESVVKVLEDKGTFSQKLTEARLLLGTTQPRGVSETAQAKAAIQAKAKAEAEKIKAEAIAAGDSPKVANAKAALAAEAVKKGPVTSHGNKWDLTDLQSKQPIEAIVLLVASGIKIVEIPRVLQACEQRLKQGDDVDKTLADHIGKALDAYSMADAEVITVPAQKKA